MATLRISSLIESDCCDADVQLLAQCVGRALLKPQLRSFELILTLLEEDPPALKLQSVVGAVCRALQRQTSLRSIHLDVGLCASQIVELCATLEQCDGVRNVSLPHLRCDRSASVAALARLLTVRQLDSLALPFCWTGGNGGVATMVPGGVGGIGNGRADDAPSSSSGVSMGSSSGMGSSTTGTLFKQSSITSSSGGGGGGGGGVGGAFCSLPRGTMTAKMNAAAAAAAAASMAANQMTMISSSLAGRSATLPRQPLDVQPHYSKQRSYDSVVSKMWYATPPTSSSISTTVAAAASAATYENCGGIGVGALHDLLMAVQADDSRLASLDLSKSQLGADDAVCLGEALRQSLTLHSVRLEGATRLTEVLPAMLGAGESRSVQMLVLSSARLSVDDAPAVMMVRALMCCSTMRLLVLDGWSYRFEVGRWQMGWFFSRATHWPNLLFFFAESHL